MKHLIILRHSKSSWKQSHLSDRQRPLNSRGKKDAVLMPRILYEKGLIPEIILTSPAVRAKALALNLKKELELNDNDFKEDERLYFGGEDVFEELASEMNDSINTLAMVSHNPDISAFAMRFANFTELNVPTSGILVLDYPIDHWNEISSVKGILKAFLKPAMFK